MYYLQEKDRGLRDKSIHDYMTISGKDLSHFSRKLLLPAAHVRSSHLLEMIRRKYAR